jgi:hypothetical protein
VELELGSLGAHDGLSTIAPSGGDPSTGEDVLADAVRVAGGCLGGRLLAAYAVVSVCRSDAGGIRWRGGSGGSSTWRPGGELE